MTRAFCLVVAGLTCSAGIALAQCPDGTPRPCATRLAGGSPARRDPPLDERLWLVLPFENSARIPEADLIAQASVTLLNQELGHWQDLRVVPDDRVSDLLRQVPEAQQRSIGLEASLGLARRVGAGHIVVGSYLAIGGRANLTARSYETRTGRQLKSVPDRLTGYQSDAGLDSLGAVFGRMARAILDVPPAERGGAINVGTGSVVAYREYVRGLAAFNRWRVDSAAFYLRRALAQDSAFAMAHLYLGVSLNGLGDVPASRRELDAAAQYTEGLSPHARLVVGFWRASNVERCAIAPQMLGADSTDAWGWIALGTCNQRGDVEVVPSGPHFRRNHNAAVRAFSRALELDPGNLFAFAYLVSELWATSGGACAVNVSRPGGTCPGDQYYWSAPLLEADTIVDRPLRYSDNPFRHPAMSRAAGEAQRYRLSRAREIAERWTSANPRQWYGRYAYSYVLLGLGDLEAARRELDAAHEAAQIPQQRRFYYRDRVELELRQEHPREAVLYTDSMFLDATANQQPQYWTAFGRFSRDQNATDPAGFAGARAAFMQLFAGVTPANADSMIELFEESRVSVNGPESQATVRRSVQTLATLLGFHARRTGPALDTASVSPLLRFQSFMARGDTARARQDLARYDQEVADGAADEFDGGQVFSAESHLELGDSTAALEELRAFARLWPHFWMQPATYFPTSAGVGFNSPVRLAGRAWLLYADLAMARGLREEARRGYRMVVGMWEGGEPPVQPMVARARAALAQLGN